MAQPSLDGQTVPVAGAITTPVLTGAANKTPVTHNASNSGGRAYAAISTATTTLVLTGAGRLCRIHVPGTGGTLGNVTVYDSLTATGTVLFGPTSPSAGQIIDLQIPVGTGITVVTAAATAAIVTYESY
jgi:hypothetical protein